MTKSKTIRTLVAAGCVASSGCVSGPQQRLPPKPEECPPGADMTHKAFDLRFRDIHGASLVPVERMKPKVPVQEGEVTAEIIGPWGKLRNKTFFSGRLYFGTDRVYGRFTKARLPSGEVLPVCLQLWHEYKLGIPMEPESTRNRVIVSPSAWVMPVDSFD